MRKIKKLSVLLLVYSLLMTSVTGCKQDNASSENASASVSTEAAQADMETEKVQEGTESEAENVQANTEESEEAPTPEPLPAPEDTYTGGVMRTDMTSAEFAAEMGVGINLGNTMEAYWEAPDNKTSGAQMIGLNITSSYETCWGAVVTTKEAIAGMKEAGFHTVRVPVYWGNMMANDGTYTINSDYMERVQEIVDYCLENRLYVIINVHHYDEFLIKNHTEDEVVEAAGIIWTQIANYFINYSDYLIFEGFNEALGTVPAGSSYTDEQKYDYVNRMNQAFVDAVRATGGNNESRLLIASGYWTNIDLTTSELYKVPTDTVSDRIMVSVHYVDNTMYWTGKIGGQEWWDYSVAQCDLLKKAFTDKGYQVFVGECTSIYEAERFAADATTTTSSECLEKMLNLITDYGFVPVLWDVNNNFYSRTSHEIKSETDAEVINRIVEKLSK